MNSKNLTKQSLLSKGFFLFFLYAIPTIACCFKPHIIQAEFFEVPKYCIYVSHEYSCPHQLSLYPSFQWMVPQIPPEVFRVPSKSSSLPSLPLLSPPLPSSSHSAVLVLISVSKQSVLIFSSLLMSLVLLTLQVQPAQVALSQLSWRMTILCRK